MMKLDAQLAGDEELISKTLKDLESKGDKSAEDLVASVRTNLWPQVVSAMGPPLKRKRKYHKCQDSAGHFLDNFMHGTNDKECQETLPPISVTSSPCHFFVSLLAAPMFWPLWGEQWLQNRHGKGGQAHAHRSIFKGHPIPRSPRSVSFQRLLGKAFLEISVFARLLILSPLVITGEHWTGRTCHGSANIAQKIHKNRFCTILSAAFWLCSA